MEFYWPASTGEWLASLSAFATLIFGVVIIAMPRGSLAFLRPKTHSEHPRAVSEMRATLAGFYMGVGLCSLLFAQPLLYLTLGASWALTACCRIVSILIDRGNTAFNWIFVAIEALLALLPLAYALGYIS